jgi:hypothetical protein
MIHKKIPKKEPETEPHRRQSTDAQDARQQQQGSKNGLTPEVEIILMSLPPIKFRDKIFHVYQKDIGCWEITDVEKLRNMIFKLAPGKSRRQIDCIIGLIETARYSEDNFSGPTILTPCLSGNLELRICVKNGVVKVSSKGKLVLEQHNAKWMFEASLNVEFDPKAKCGAFLQELKAKLHDVEDQELLGISSAYVLIPRFHLNYLLFLYGDHNSGKSTISKAVTNVFGRNLVSALGLGDICPPPEKLSDISWRPELARSILNIGRETDAREIKDVSNLKAWSAGEEFQARGFQRAGGKMVPRAKGWFVMNGTPIFNGGAEIYDRIRILYFSEVTQGEIDTKLDDQLATERNGIFLWILSFVQKAMEATSPPFGGVESQKIYKEFVDSTNPYGEFAKRYGQLGKEYKCTPLDLKRAMADFHELFDSGESLRKSFQRTFQRRYHLTKKQLNTPFDHRRYYFGFKLCGPEWERCVRKHKSIMNDISSAE